MRRLAREPGLDQLLQLARRHFLDLAGRQIAQVQGAVGDADQPVHLQPQGLEHLAHLAVLALGQADAHPDVRARAALDPGLDRAVGDALDGDPRLQAVELLLGGAAIGPGAVAAHHAGGRQFQLPGQSAVVGQEQQALGVQVQAADGDHPRQVLGKAAEHGGPALGVVVGGDQAGGLVIAPEPRRLAVGHHLAVQREDVLGAHIDGRAGEHLAVQRHPPGLDQPLGLAPRRHPGPGEGAGHPLAVLFG